MEKLSMKFLAAGLLPELTADEHVKYLSAAVTEVSKKILKSASNLISYTLAGLDPNLSIDNPVAKEVDEAIKKHWKTIHNNVSTEPRQIWRAIIWDALSGQSRDATNAAVIWYTGASVLPHSDIGAAERDLLEQFLLGLRGQVEKDFISRSIASQLDGDEDLSSLSQVEIKSVFTDGFKSELMKASGPNDTANAAMEGANPNWPGSNTPQWTSVFADKAARAIAQRINGSSKQVLDAVAEYADGLEKRYRDRQKSLQENSAYRRLQNDLLWWRQSHYSPTFKKGYREINPEAVPLAMAVDVHQLVGGTHPISVEYLLREAIRSVKAFEVDEQLLIGKLIESVGGAADSRTAIASVQGYYRSFGEFMPLAGILKRGIDENKLDGTLLKKTVISKNAKLSRSDLAIWVFRDLQAFGLATNTK